MNNVLFLRSMPVEQDSRSTKMIAQYRTRGTRVLSLIWSRDGSAPKDSRVIACTSRGAYGKKLWGMKARMAFCAFVVREMVRRRSQYDAVHLVDFDTAVVGLPVARLLGKPVIYDAFDSVQGIVGGALGRFLALLERKAIELSQIAIFPDRSRLEQYGIRKRNNIVIISNIPENIHIMRQPSKAGRNKIKIAYIGTLESRHRGLEYIPDICQNHSEIEFLVGGTGELSAFFKNAALCQDNLTFVGQQAYDSALVYMSEADAIYGPYLLSAPAHQYASPNKMYEHLLLGKALITNEGTPPGDLVSKLQTGILFSGSLRDLEEKLAETTREEIAHMGDRARAAWESTYSSLRNEQLSAFFDKFSKLADSDH